MAEKQKFKTQPYIYSGASQMTAGSTGQIPFQVSSNYHFMCTGFTYRAVTSAAANVQATFDIQILRNDETLFFDFTPSDFFAGVLINSNAAPFVRTVLGLTNWYTFAKPYPFLSKSNILINLRNTCGQVNTVTVGLQGYKVIVSA
jgi:hypothetical protein